MFTVFTPTYNRAHTLPRVYDSLRSQTCRCFEWVIVDDGSTDSTSKLVKKWQQEAIFPIRYIYQKNSGKHVAFNLGVQEAKGELFLPIDSDDACVPEALERFHYHWSNIPKKIRSQYSGISCLCIDGKGNTIGTKYPYDYMESNLIDIYHKYKVKGDKWGFTRTDILHKTPFPVIEGENFIAEGIVWNRIAKTYQMIFINESLEHPFYCKGGLTSSINRIRIHSPKGACLYYEDAMQLNIPYLFKLKYTINFIRFYLHAHKSIKNLLQEKNCILRMFILLPVSYIMFLSDKLIPNKKGV